MRPTVGFESKGPLSSTLVQVEPPSAESRMVAALARLRPPAQTPKAIIAVASFFINFVFCNPIFQSRHERRSPIFIPGQLLTVQYNRNRDAINLSPFISVMFFVSVPAIKVTISRTVRE